MGGGPAEEHSQGRRAARPQRPGLRHALAVPGRDRLGREGHRRAAQERAAAARLADARDMRQSDLADSLWIRPLDIPRALEARTYATEGSLVIEVVDGEAPGGRTRVLLDATTEGATCRATHGRRPDDRRQCPQVRVPRWHPAARRGDRDRVRRASRGLARAGRSAPPHGRPALDIDVLLGGPGGTPGTLTPQVGPDAGHEPRAYCARPVGSSSASRRTLLHVAGLDHDHGHVRHVQGAEVRPALDPARGVVVRDFRPASTSPARMAVARLDDAARMSSV